MHPQYIRVTTRVLSRSFNINVMFMEVEDMSRYYVITRSVWPGNSELTLSLKEVIRERSIGSTVKRNIAG